MLGGRRVVLARRSVLEVWAQIGSSVSASDPG